MRRRGLDSGPDAAELVRSIERLARLARRAVERDAMDVRPRSLFEPAPKAGSGPEAGEPRRTGWWVLAQGAVLDPEDFEARESARAELLEAVRASGVLVGENVWVWDESGRAQLVLATLPTRERALRVAERLRAKGLGVVVRREMP
jgi:hypothetical protein